MTTPIEQTPDYDQFCQLRLLDPFPLLARLRAEQPVHFCEPMQVWLITRYDDIFQGLRDTKRLSSSRDGMYLGPLTPDNRPRAQPLIQHISGWLQNLDAPDHTRLRKLVGLAFTPRMIADLQPRIQQIINQLLTDIGDADECEFNKSFCLPLPAMVICDMLGIPTEYQRGFRHAMEEILPFSSGGGPRLNEALDPALSRLNELTDLFTELIDRRRREPREDLISAMAAAEADGDRLSADEMMALCVFLFNAGHETTMSLLAGGTHALLTHPDQFALLAEDPDARVESAVEEFVRYHNPVTRSIRRVAENFTWRGRSLKHGQTITMLLMAANRDPDQFPDPDRLDILRHPNKHLGFGFGIHFCLGAPLARLEARIAFRTLVDHLPHWQLAGDDIELQPTFGLRSLKQLRLRRR